MMERRAKERLIGASILVVLIVLVVPELLSGPKPAPPPPTLPPLPAIAASADSVRNVTVDLATSKAPTTADPEAASASAAAAPAAPIAASAVRATPAIPEPLPVESATLAPIYPAGAAHGEVPRASAWAVQLGSFASRVNADKLTHQLKAQGFTVYVLSGGSGTAIRHRVRVGPLVDRDTAERTAAKLKALGHPSSLVSPGA